MTKASYGYKSTTDGQNIISKPYQSSQPSMHRHQAAARFPRTRPQSPFHRCFCRSLAFHFPLGFGFLASIPMSRRKNISSPLSKSRTMASIFTFPSLNCCINPEILTPSSIFLVYDIANLVSSLPYHFSQPFSRPICAIYQSSNYDNWQKRYPQ